MKFSCYTSRLSECQPYLFHQDHLPRLHEAARRESVEVLPRGHFDAGIIARIPDQAVFARNHGLVRPHQGANQAAAGVVDDQPFLEGETQGGDGIERIGVV